MFSSKTLKENPQIAAELNKLNREERISNIHQALIGKRIQLSEGAFEKTIGVFPVSPSVSFEDFLDSKEEQKAELIISGKKHFPFHNNEENSYKLREEGY